MEQATGNEDRKIGSFSKIAVLALLLLTVVVAQAGYDATKPAAALSSAAGLSPGFVRAVDAGFHASVGSFLWAGTMPEILDAIFNDRMEYLADESYVNNVDPKLSFPYAFSVIVVPAVTKYKDRITESLAIGERGIRNADPDWRIPYWMATTYFLELKDNKDALWYYYLAAHTPGIPDYAERFAINFGIKSTERQNAEELWTTIRDSAKDDLTKERAQAYIDRYQIFDYLDAASRSYQERYGRVPTSTGALVSGGIIPSIPEDPFGFAFVMNKDGTSGINTTSSFEVPQGE